jgi:hypothetical protein
VIDTVQWEGFREGVDDVRYLSTLLSRVAYSKKIGTNVSPIEKWISDLKQADISTKNLDDVRNEMAEYIMSLPEVVLICTPDTISGCKVCSADGFSFTDDDAQCSGSQKCFRGNCTIPITQNPSMVMPVAIKSGINNKYVCAESGGNKPLIANRDAVSTWETFELMPQSDGTVAFRSQVNNKYVTAESGGTEPLIANRSAIGLWEKFTLKDAGLGYIALNASVNGKYVTAESAGAEPLIANRSAIGLWEKFAIIPLWVCSPNIVSGCKVCDENGSGWTDDNSRCPAGQTCVNGNCSASTTTSTTTTTTSTSRSSSTSTTSTTVPQCAMPGNYPPCAEVALSEVVAAINQWAADEFDLRDVISLINSWADPLGYPPQ